MRARDRGAASKPGNQPPADSSEVLVEERATSLLDVNPAPFLQWRPRLPFRSGCGYSLVPNLGAGGICLAPRAGSRYLGIAISLGQGQSKCVLPGALPSVTNGLQLLSSGGSCRACSSKFPSPTGPSESIAKLPLMSPGELLADALSPSWAVSWSWKRRKERGSEHWHLFC